MPAEAVRKKKLVTSFNLPTASSRPDQSPRAHGRVIAAVLLALAVLVIYAPALRNGFVWDDQALILRDPLIRSWRLIWEGFQHFLFTDVTASNFYRPLQRLSYTIDYAIFFESPVGYHLSSILCHASAAIALFLFAGEFLRGCEVAENRRVTIAFVSALVWAIHPVQSAAVVYVSGRADPLSACFGFLALYLILRMFRGQGRAKWILGFVAAACFLGSALSKEMGLVFLPLALLLALVAGDRKSLLGAIGIGLCVVIAYLSLRLPAEKLAPPPVPSMPPFVRAVVVTRAIAEYAGLLVFPWHLRMERDVETHPFGFVRASLTAASWRELQTLLGLVLIVSGVIAVWRSRRHREIFVPLLLGLISYLPISGIVPLNATVAEHWLYLPSAFLFIGAVAALSLSGGRSLYVCLTIWLIFLSGRTLVRTFDWKDERTFLSRTIADGGDSARMLINLGDLELSEGHLESARVDLERALQKEPDNPLARLNLAAVKLKARDFPSARLLLQKVTQPAELRAKAEETLAVLESRESGMINLMRLRLAARLGPPNWEIEQRYIKALVDSGFIAKGVTELRVCLSLAPYRGETWLMMSELLSKINRPNEAAIALAQAEARDVHLQARLAR